MMDVRETLYQLWLDMDNWLLSVMAMHDICKDEGLDYEDECIRCRDRYTDEVWSTSSTTLGGNDNG